MTSFPKTFFGYVRVSTLKQGMHGSSLQEQKAAIEAYAQRNGIAVAEWFEERETAAKRGRSVFSRMLKALEGNKAQGVIIHKIDRSARNLRDWADLADLIDRGVEVHFAHDTLDLRSRGGRLSADIQAVVAADFIRNLREETRKGFYGRLKQGIYPLPAPTGYLDTGRGNAKAIDPVKAPLVRQAFELYASGEYNFERLQAELFRRGLHGQAGKPISFNGLTTLLNNPFYMGLIHIRTTNELFDGAHTPLITKALYDRVQAVLRGIRSGTPYKNDFLFRRLIRCTHCKRSLIGERQKGRYIYYRCHTKGCLGACLTETTIDAAIREKLSPLQFTEQELGDVRDFAEVLRNEDKDTIEKREAVIRLQIAKCDERLARLTDALIDGLIDKETFDARKSATLTKKRGYKDQLGSPSVSLADMVMKNVELANVAYLTYQNGSPDEKRELVLSVTSNFLGSGKYPAITLKSPFQEYLFFRNSSGCDPRRDEPRTFAQKLFKLFARLAKKEMNSLDKAV